MNDRFKPHGGSSTGRKKAVMTRVLPIMLIAIATVLGIVGMRAFADSASTASTTNGVTAINTFETQLVSGGDARTNSSGGTDYVWTPGNDLEGHRYTFRVNFATSGVGEVDGATLDENGNVEAGKYGAIQIRIPKSILLDRDGKAADTIEMSVPAGDELSQMDDEDKKDNDYAYSIDGDDIVFYNWRSVTAAQNGYFEVSYITNKKTESYLDYDGKDSSAYKDGSNPFKATITAGSLTKSSDEKRVYIDTSATLTSVEKESPTQTGGVHWEWDSSWGTKPSDADDYYYLVWEVRANIKNPATATYSLEVTDTPSSKTGAVEVVGYKMGTSSTYTMTNKLTGLTDDYTKYIYVLTRHKKSTFDKDSSGKAITQYTINNKVTVRLHTVDGVDADSVMSASRKYDWTKPTWNPPSGHVQMVKYGNENWQGDHLNTGYHSDWTYASYDLDLLQDGKTSSIGGIKYQIEAVGYTFPWTQDMSSSDAKSSDMAKVAATYGQNPVKYVLADDTMYLLKSDNNTFSNVDFDEDKDASKETPLSSDDYDFDSIGIDISLQDVQRDSNGKPTYNTHTANFDEISHTFTDDDTIVIETKSGTTWSTAGTLHLKSGTFDSATGSKVKSVSGSNGRYTITFNTGVDGYRLTNSNKYYATFMNVMPLVSLKNTTNVMSIIGSGTSAEDQVLLKNKADMEFIKSDNTSIAGTLRRIIGDRLRRTERDSSIKKNVVAHKNNVMKKRYEITWRVHAEETYLTGSGESVQRNYIPQNGGTIYDLLPAGANFKQDSLIVDNDTDQLNDSAYSYELIQNWKDSGRTMLIVHITETANAYTLFYTTTHAWTSLKDYGDNVKNPVGYETGNDSITNGYPDDGGDLTAPNKSYYANLDSTTDAKKFIYSEAEDEVSAITSAQAGLKKQVISSTDDNWGTETTVSTDSTYRYRLRFANTYITKAKDIILYDSIENYSPDANTHSTWHGTLTGVDVSQVKLMGANPVVYLSATESLDLSEEKTNTDLTDTSVWLTMDAFKAKYGSLAKAKAVAIDMRKKADGSDFILAEGQSVAPVLVMQSPSESPSGVTGYPLTYNDIHVKDTVIDTYGHTQNFYITQAYTTVKYAITSSFKLHKVSSENANRNISNIQFRVYGTSDYGTAVDITKSTGRDGIIDFKNIEKGTYTLQEGQGSVDWLEDHTPHTVVIDNTRKVTIDGTTVYDPTTDATTPFVIKNTPRVHADVSLEKVDSIHTSSKVAGATYRLSGTSDYGNDIVMYSTSDKYGTLTFANVEMGTYTVKETQAPDGYIVNNTEYKVKINKAAEVSVTYTGDVVGDTVTKYSHTPNVNDDGTTNTAYADNLSTNDVVTIPNAKKLHVKIVFGGESASYDWVCMWQGGHATYTATNDYSTSITGKLGGGSHTATSNTKEYDVEGDTVTFAFKSDGSGSGDGYGYYAVVTGNPLTQGDVTPQVDKSTLAYELTDEPYHYITFVKRSSYDSSAVEGAEFSLKGTSDYGTAVDMTATSDDVGQVRFDKLEPGTYIMVETKAPDGYELNKEQHIVVVNSDGTYTMSGMSKYSTSS